MDAFCLKKTKSLHKQKQKLVTVSLMLAGDMRLLGQKLKMVCYSNNVTRVPAFTPVPLATVPRGKCKEVQVIGPHTVSFV